MKRNWRVFASEFKMADESRLVSGSESCDVINVSID